MAGRRLTCGVVVERAGLWLGVRAAGCGLRVRAVGCACGLWAARADGDNARFGGKTAFWREARLGPRRRIPRQM